MTVPARGLEVEKVEEIKTMLGLRLIDEDLYNCVVSSIIQRRTEYRSTLYLDEEYNAKNQRKPIYCRFINCSDSSN